MNGRPIRILTGVAAFDGHDASVLALNRALLVGARPLEVVYLGFNMTGEQIAAAALQEDVDAVAISSYNGGHLQFFPYLVRRLAELGMARTQVFGGGGGTILPEDAATLEEAGVAKIYGPGWALDAIAEDLLERIAGRAGEPAASPDPDGWPGAMPPAAELTRLLSLAERGGEAALGPYGGWLEQAADSPSRVLALAGDGGSGKSTLIDELVGRFLETFPQKKIAILANDPTTRSGQAATAFLADRVRMNHIYDGRVWLRSVATGSAYAPLSPALPHLLQVLRAARFDLVIVETPGTGQTGLDLAALQADLLVYLKTREYGSGLQLQKDQLLRDADLVVLNKADLEGAESAFAEMRSVLQEQGKPAALFPATAKAARDPGLDRLFAVLCRRLGWPAAEGPAERDIFRYARHSLLVPHRRRAYLAEIAEQVRDYDRWAREQIELVRRDPGDLQRLDPACARLLREWPERWRQLSLQAAGRCGMEPHVETPNGLQLPRVALPNPEDRAEALRFLLEEGLPGCFPFATGIHPYRPASAGETTRQFAGLRGPEQTNQRLHYLARGVAKPRLSIAFDGITLYGADSDDDPASLGKIGEGGVAIDTWEDMKLVLEGFQIPEISTSMTINGPAPVLLAMYFVAAGAIERERLEAERGRALSAEEARDLDRQLRHSLRGTVQADILKEVQAQNESIFQPDFAVRLLGDVQQWFIDHEVKKFYSLSISGYHIGEAGASPVQELAFTLANGFTYVENFRARGMAVDDFAPSLSFFFKVSHEAEWLAYGAVCRKIWAIALREVYRGGEAAQKFKFHTQTSGRALQAEEWDTLNPVRLTYHALLGMLANSNSLHVDSADEPMTTPGEKWVRQATMIPNYLREEAEGFLIQNLLSGSYAFRTLLREVQEQVLQEFERIDQLGGVGPATEQGYQRRCIAENSAKYERERRRSGKDDPQGPRRRIIGYNMHELPEGHPDRYPPVAEVVRPDPADWERQLARLRDFRERHAEDAPEALARLKKVALEGGNVFGELLETVRHASLGQITRTLAEVGGRYRKMV
ncbi:Fused isobutyryl-CoA mutase [Desulfuromonas versatilis]|uniref:Fused isobutyryl-CoA mutase n=1 Tax=Desulfuromonas versatilis TaxID=2802975 RepID=A0ABM8HR70_9BACT|nr:methylmalonyl-CoA mutase family protein [Desulfuromonas versatilis]BCR03431.1 Fused isobutyryl-CoA mutase [Desulfuromonas versatilis]